MVFYALWMAHHFSMFRNNWRIKLSIETLKTFKNIKKSFVQFNEFGELKFSSVNTQGLFVVWTHLLLPDGKVSRFESLHSNLNVNSLNFLSKSSSNPYVTVWLHLLAQINARIPTSRLYVKINLSTRMKSKIPTCFLKWPSLFHAVSRGGVWLVACSALPKHLAKSSR